jgi:endonuclease I
LTKQQCTYCRREGISGLDRVNNNLGYDLENAVPCCRRCNTAKGNGTLKEFIEWAIQLVKTIVEDKIDFKRNS